MFKILFTLAILCFTTFSFAQYDTLWLKTSGNSNLPSWFSATGHTERGFTFANVDGQERLFVVSRNGGLFVKILNANTGEDAGDLNVSGISGGTFPLNDIGASEDGILFGANLAIGTGSANAFKVYRWNNEAAVPIVVFADSFANQNIRIGDRISVQGKASDNSLKIHLADATQQKFYTLSTNDNGATFTLTDSVVLPAATLGGAASVYKIGDYYVSNSSGRNITVWDQNGQLFGTIPGGIVATGSTATVLNTEADNYYLITFQFGAGNENARIVDINSDYPAYARSYAVTTSLGVNANPNGTGDVAMVLNPDGSYKVFILGTNNGIGAYHLRFPSIINGRFQEAYQLVAQKQNNNLGFGENIDVSGIYYRVVNNTLYIGVRGKLDKSNNNGIGILLGLSNLVGQGKAAGQAAGGVNNGGHFFGNTGNNNWAADFELHYGFVLNPGGNDSVVYVDAVTWRNGGNGQYLGFAHNSGSAKFGPDADGIFTANSITFAYDSAYGINRGFEIAIPLSQIGNPSQADQIRLSSFVVSSTAFFSDVTVPGNVTGGNPGFNTNFNTLGGGPYNSGAVQLPVELISFSANSNGNNIILNWQTATEINNSGFAVERKNQLGEFEQIGFVIGSGTTTEKRSYSFTDENLTNGIYSYRLKQIDLDGTYSYLNTIEIELGNQPNDFSLSQNFPNPFNPSTEIRYQLSELRNVVLKVYDVLGNEVATLVNEQQTAGSYKISFNADEYNLSTGVYLYKLNAGDFVQTKKLILIK